VMSMRQPKSSRILLRPGVIDGEEAGQSKNLMSEIESELVLEERLGWKRIHGVYCPPFFREDAVSQLRFCWEPRDSDVFLVSNFPLRGLQRVLTCLVEGRSQPWDAGLLDKPYFCDAAASRRGVAGFLQEVDSWTHRRCFKTHALPHSFPCRYPEPFLGGRSKQPKIVVLVTDPRLVGYVWWQCISQVDHTGLLGQMDLKAFLNLAPAFAPFGSFADHALAWAREAEKYPESVRLFRADRLGSLLKGDVLSELIEIANFLEIPEADAVQLADAMFFRPADANRALASDTLVHHDALRGGHIVETSGHALHQFQNALDASDGMVQDSWNTIFKGLLKSAVPFLVELAQPALHGASSLPPPVLTGIFRGPEAHAAGTCKPCVFALRGACKTPAGECLYCHEPGHAKTKRASHAVRKQRKLRQEIARTPSPGW